MVWSCRQFPFLTSEEFFSGSLLWVSCELAMLLRLQTAGGIDWQTDRQIDKQIERRTDQHFVHSKDHSPTIFWQKSMRPACSKYSCAKPYKISRNYNKYACILNSTGVGTAWWSAGWEGSSEIYMIAVRNPWVLCEGVNLLSNAQHPSQCCRKLFAKVIFLLQRNLPELCVSLQRTQTAAAWLMHPTKAAHLQGLLNPI